MTTPKQKKCQLKLQNLGNIVEQSLVRYILFLGLPLKNLQVADG